MSRKNEIIDPKEKKRIRRANIIAFFVELCIIILYFLVAFVGISNGFKGGNIVKMVQSVEVAVTFLISATLLVAILFLTIKPLRTRTTVSWAIFDIVWAVSCIVTLFM